VVRVAFLSREAGQSVAEATLFGTFVGGVFFALVVLLGWLACRGNQLGDLLRAGAEVVARLDALVQEGQRRVTTIRLAALRSLSDADGLRSEAKDIRAWVVSQYWQAMLLAVSWLGLDGPAVVHSELVLPRTLSVADAASELVEGVRAKIGRIDEWLDEPAAAPTGVMLALPAAGAQTTQRLGPPAGQPPGLVRVGLGYAIPKAPREPRWLLGAVAVGAVVVAFGAAVIAPTPDVGLGSTAVAAIADA
jgi:hypothetical protein